MKLAFVFPGQGSQYVGMLRDFGAERVVQDSFQEAADVLQQDLWQLASEGPEEELNSTANTQPLLLAAGVALWRLWQDKGGTQPQYLAGHSLGEYTSLVCAGAIDFAVALKLVRSRGKYMQMAMKEERGAMAAILGLGYEEVKKICDATSASSYVYPANINSPKQIVISGYETGVEEAGEAAKGAGAKRVVLLPVSVPSHCALMHPAAELLAADLELVDIKPPNISVIHNVDAIPVKDPSAIKEKLIQQLTKSVLWVDTIGFIVDQGVKQVAECGPKKVLSALNKSISPDIQSFALGESKDDFSEALRSI